MRVIILVLVLFIYNSCNKEEQNVIVLPGDFEISIHSLASNSVLIRWTESISKDGAIVSYNIYLNDVLLSEGLNQYEYEVNNLMPQNNYVVKIVAENNNGTLERTLRFTTLLPEEVFLPGDFEINIESLTPVSAVVKWTESVAEDGSDILYTVYLDNTLVAENINQLEYFLNNLVPETYYTVKVVAENLVGVNEQTIQFTTPAPSELYLYKMRDSGSNSHLFEYDVNYNLIGHIENHDQPGWEFYYEYQYENNLIIKERSFGYGYYSGICNYFYGSNGLERINYRRGDDIILEDKYEFNSDHTSYTREFIKENHITGETTTILYSNIATYNGQNNLTKLVTQNETMGGDSKTIHFQYDGSNLIKITDSENNVWDISYDNKKRLKTFNGHFEGAQFTFGLKRDNFLEDEIVKELMLIPFFYTFNNQNNITEVKKNGNLFSKINYQYNSYEYPIEALVNNQAAYTFEYIIR